ncbi:unnamed protein product [Boreogadus saida]
MSLAFTPHHSARSHASRPPELPPFSLFAAHRSARARSLFRSSALTITRPPRFLSTRPLPQPLPRPSPLSRPHSLTSASAQTRPPLRRRPALIACLVSPTAPFSSLLSLRLAPPTPQSSPAHHSYAHPPVAHSPRRRPLRPPYRARGPSRSIPSVVASPLSRTSRARSAVAARLPALPPRLLPSSPNQQPGSSLLLPLPPP